MLANIPGMHYSVAAGVLSLSLMASDCIGHMENHGDEISDANNFGPIAMHPGSSAEAAVKVRKAHVSVSDCMCGHSHLSGTCDAGSACNTSMEFIRDVPPGLPQTREPRCCRPWDPDSA